MKITIDIPPLTFAYLERLVARGEADTVEQVVDHCFMTVLARQYEHDMAVGLEIIDF